MLREERSKWWVLFVSIAASSLLLMDSTTMPVALPAIQRELHFTYIGAMWVINAYLLSFTMVLLVGGRLAELFGYRRLYVLGLVLLGAGSILGGISFSDRSLLIARVIQGLAGGLLYPSTIALLTISFPLHQRARALGIDTGVASIFMLLGPLIGGFLTQYFSWRYIFWMNLPLVVLGLLMGGILLRKAETKREPFPYVSSLVGSFGVLALIYGLMESEQLGWHYPLVMSALLLGPVCLGTFAFLSLRAPYPLADLRLFKRYPSFLGSNVVRFLIYLTVTASILWIVFFETALGYSPFEIGLFMLISVVPVVVMAPLGGYLADRFGYKLPLIVGHLLVAFCLVWLLLFSGSTQILSFLPGLFCFAMGIALIMSPSIALGLCVIPPERLGTATALTATLRQLASTLGVAIMTTVYYKKTATEYVGSFQAVTAMALLFVVLGIIATLVLVTPPSEEHPQYNR